MAPVDFPVTIWVQARRAERQQAREERVKQLGGVLRKDSTPGLPLALAIASSMTVVQGVCAGTVVQRV